MSQPSTVCSFLDVQRLGVRSTPPSPHPRSKHHQFLSCSAIEGAASGERVEKAKNSRASQGHIVASHRCFLESFSYSKDGKPIGCLHGANNYGIGLSCHCMYFLFHSKMDPKMQLIFFCVNIMAHTSVKPPITRAVHESLCDSLCHTHFLEANMAACKRASVFRPKSPRINQDCWKRMYPKGKSTETWRSHIIHHLYMSKKF